MDRQILSMGTVLLVLSAIGLPHCGTRAPQPIKLDNQAEEGALALDIEIHGLRKSSSYTLCLDGRVGQDGSDSLKRFGVWQGHGYYDFATKLADLKGVLVYKGKVELPVGKYNVSFLLKDVEKAHKCVVEQNNWRFTIPLKLAGREDTTGADTGKPVTVRLRIPKSSGGAVCRAGGDGIYRFTVEGTSKGVAKRNMQLLLWVKPVSPASETPGWYLQRPPSNGITELRPDGSWTGIGQIGNAQWPPHAGDILDVAVTVVNSSTAKQLLDAPGVVVRRDLPGQASNQVTDVRVSFK